MDIYDTLAYMNLKDEDFHDPIFSKTDDIDTERTHSELFQRQEIVIRDDDDSDTERILEVKSEKKMKRIHIPNAIIKPFHNRFNKNIVKSDEQQYPSRTTSTTKSCEK